MLVKQRVFEVDTRLKTTSNRFKEEKHGYGTSTILAFVFSIVFGPVGLILRANALNKDGDSELLRWALGIGIATTVLWAFAIIYWIWWYATFWAIYSPIWWL